MKTELPIIKKNINLENKNNFDNNSTFNEMNSNGSIKKNGNIKALGSLVFGNLYIVYKNNKSKKKYFKL